MTGKIRALALAAALSAAATTASAVVMTPFDTPLSAGDSTFGRASAAAFEDFNMATLTFEAATPLRAEVAIAVNPFMTDVSGNPANVIHVAYQISGGLLIDLAIMEVSIGTGSIGASALDLKLDAGDTLSFFITGTGGQSGDQVTFAVETSSVPILPGAVLGLTGLAALIGLRRRSRMA